MRTVHPSPFLKWALLADAAVSGAAGVLQLSAAGPLSALLNLPQALLAGTGEFLLVYALLLLVMATRVRLWAALVAFVVLGNGLWAAASAGLLLGAGLGAALSPNALGSAFVLMQAVAVLVFAALEWRGLSTSQPTAASGRAVMP